MLLLGFTLCMNAQERVPSIAVIAFEGRGISEEEASTLTDRFRSELVRTESFMLIERSRMEQVLGEQQFQMSGAVSEDQAVEIGRLLGAQLIAFGAVGQLGKTYTIDLRLVEVATGQVVSSYSRDHRGEIDGLLWQFNQIATEMAAKSRGESYEMPTPTVDLTPQRAQASALGVKKAEVRKRAKEHAKQDFKAGRWAGGGAVLGAGGALLGFIPGGAVGVLVSAFGGKMMDASVPADRLEAIQEYDLITQEIYIEAYEDHVQRLRFRAGGGGSSVGCCAGLLVVGALLNATAAE